MTYLFFADSELLERVPKNITQPSLLDVFQHSWVFLSENALWKDAAKDATSQLGVQARFVHVGKDIETEGDFRKTFGVGQDGVVLVRPDGYIAWRHTAGESEIDTHQAVIALRRVAAILA